MYCSTALSPGGELTWFRRTIAALDQTTFEPWICSIRTPKASDAELRSLGAPVFSLGVDSPYNVMLGAWRLRRFVREHNADLIHMSLFGSEITPFLGALLGRTPLLATVNTTMDPYVVGRASRSRKTQWTLRAARCVQSLLARLTSTHFVALSESVAKSTKTFLRASDSNVTVVNIGLDMAECSPVVSGGRPLREQLGIGDRAPVLINVARLSHAKDQEQAILAMPKVAARYPEALLLVVGDGPLRQHLESMAERVGMERHVMFLGRRNDVLELLQMSDVFVFTSRYEGQPHAVIEAMAAGRPVVSYDIPATAELVEHGRSGFLVAERDPGSFANAVIEVLDDPEMAHRMGQRGREVVLARFDIAKNTRRLEDVYSRVLGRPREHPAMPAGAP